jgi:hypothetical protein
MSRELQCLQMETVSAPRELGFGSIPACANIISIITKLDVLLQAMRIGVRNALSSKGLRAATKNV